MRRGEIIAIWLSVAMIALLCALAWDMNQEARKCERNGGLAVNGEYGFKCLTKLEHN